MPPEPPHHLPLQLTSFIGRDDPCWGSGRRVWVASVMPGTSEHGLRRHYARAEFSGYRLGAYATHSAVPARIGPMKAWKVSGFHWNLQANPYRCAELSWPSSAAQPIKVAFGQLLLRLVC
jgi:hypothetical protein